VIFRSETFATLATVAKPGLPFPDSGQVN